MAEHADLEWVPYLICQHCHAPLLYSRTSDIAHCRMHRYFITGARYWDLTEISLAQVAKTLRIELEQQDKEGDE